MEGDYSESAIRPQASKCCNIWILGTDGKKQLIITRAVYAFLRQPHGTSNWGWGCSAPSQPKCYQYLFVRSSYNWFSFGPSQKQIFPPCNLPKRAPPPNHVLANCMLGIFFFEPSISFPWEAIWIGTKAEETVKTPILLSCSADWNITGTLFRWWWLFLFGKKHANNDFCHMWFSPENREAQIKN